MIRVLRLVGLLGVVAIGGRAQTQDWRAQLKAETVTLRKGKMLYNEVGLFKLKVPGYQEAQVQVKVHSEAPAGGVVSRDNFVSRLAFADMRVGKRGRGPTFSPSVSLPIAPCITNP